MTALALDQLPVNLPAGRRYVTWRQEHRAGRPTKVPYQPTCWTVRASVNQAATWGTLLEACRSVEAGHAHGIGLVLAGDVTVIDVDHCLDRVTGQVTATAATVLETIASYSEISPSGCGLHVLTLGALPPGRRRSAELELYDTHRFITLTGRRLARTPRQLIDHTATLATLHARLFPVRHRVELAPVSVPLTEDDATLLERAHAARNGRQFGALWNGDTSRYPSHSEADAALACHLAFWTQRDPIRMDRLFRQSGLMRSKWDERRGRSTYGAETITRAITLTPAVYTPDLTDTVEVPMQ